MIQFICNACQSAYRVDPRHAGKRIACRKCGSEIQIPQMPTVEPETPRQDLIGTATSSWTPPSRKGTSPKLVLFICVALAICLVASGIFVANSIWRSPPANTSTAASQDDLQDLGIRTETPNEFSNESVSEEPTPNALRNKSVEEESTPNELDPITPSSTNWKTAAELRGMIPFTHWDSVDREENFHGYRYERLVAAAPNCTLELLSDPSTGELRSVLLTSNKYPVLFRQFSNQLNEFFGDAFTDQFTSKIPKTYYKLTTDIPIQNDEIALVHFWRIGGIIDEDGTYKYLISQPELGTIWNKMITDDVAASNVYQKKKIAEITGSD